MNFAKYLVGSFSIPTYFGQLRMLCISMLLVPAGLSLYLSADIVPMPMEGMTQALTKKLARFPFHRVKIVVDSACVLLAIAVSLIGLGRLNGIREGTVIAALITGKVLQSLNPA